GLALLHLPGHRQRGVDRDRVAGGVLLDPEAAVVACGVHADDLARGVGQRAAGVTGDDIRVGLDHVVEGFLAYRAALVARGDGLVQRGDLTGDGNDGVLPLGVAQGHYRVA